MSELAQRIVHLTGAASADIGAPIQSVWSGYGRIVRATLAEPVARSVVVKHVTPPRRSGISHERKLHSYDVEAHWYRSWRPACPTRTPECIALDAAPSEWLFVFEDLDAAGFTERTRRPSVAQLHASARWLARFHAHFLGSTPEGLWDQGTYWHLATRPDEHAAMQPGALRDHAAAIDAELARATYRTIVHGDAKPANFCWTANGARAAAVDFQYAGGGIGPQDLIYLVAGQTESTARRAIDLYFAHLTAHLASDLGPAVEREWRRLLPWAWADFERFLAGWGPGRHHAAHERAWTRGVLAALG